MKIVDLGIKDTPVLLFGGPYSNLHALEALIAQAQTLGIDPENCVCTGDVVAYCAHPSETVARIRDFGCTVIAGNCERQLAAGEMNCGCGFDPGSTCDVLSARWYAHINKHVDTNARQWMADLPDMAVFSHHGRRCAVIHGGISDISRFLWSTSDDHDFSHEICLLKEKVKPLGLVVSGHSGIAFQRELNGINWLNAGVIGMPPNNGRAETEYLVLNNGKPEFQWLAYDHEKAADAMIDAGLTQGYHTALLSGYWPSEDVLPEALRRSSCANG